MSSFLGLVIAAIVVIGSIDCYLPVNYNPGEETKKPTPFVSWSPWPAFWILILVLDFARCKMYFLVSRSRLNVDHSSLTYGVWFHQDSDWCMAIRHIPSGILEDTDPSENWFRPRTWSVISMSSIGLVLSSEKSKWMTLAWRSSWILTDCIEKCCL